MSEPSPHEEAHAHSPEPLAPRVHDEQMAVAFRFFLDRKGWRVSTLARMAWLSPKVAHQVVMGYSTDVATLRRLCCALGVEMWLFWLMADAIAYQDDQTQGKAVGHPTAEETEAYGTIISAVDQLLEARTS